jgi:hypothetical protein
MISSIEIQNFRGFANMKVEGLGLVNLVVGRNNTGKTSFLEAISILTNPDQVYSTNSILRPNEDSRGDRFNPWLIRDGAPDSQAQILGQDEQGKWGTAFRLPDSKDPWPPGVIQHTSTPHVKVGIVNQQHPKLKAQTISVHHRSPADMATTFAEAVRPSEGEDQMESLLRSVDNRIRTVRLDYTQGQQPFIVVDVGLSRKVPLSQVGQGVYRLVAIFSELLGQKPNICFIDEIENGIHYSVLTQVWEGIAEVAERFQTQVFATTHSGECLAAAHESFSKRKSYDLRVVQLYRTDGCIEGRVLNRDLIQSGLDGNIDLR